MISSKTALRWLSYCFLRRHHLTKRHRCPWPCAPLGLPPDRCAQISNYLNFELVCCWPFKVQPVRYHLCVTRDDLEATHTHTNDAQLTDSWLECDLCVVSYCFVPFAVVVGNVLKFVTVRSARSLSVNWVWLTCSSCLHWRHWILRFI